MVHIPIVSRLSLGDYWSIVLTFVILGVETCFRMVAYLIPSIIMDAGKSFVEKCVYHPFSPLVTSIPLSPVGVVHDQATFLRIYPLPLT